MTLYCPECETTYEGEEHELCPVDGSRLFSLSANQKAGDPLLGKIVDNRFRIEKLLGAGGMGAVYVGTQLSVRRQVAIKVLRPELAEREMMLERFFREAKVVSELTHPNIVRLVEFGQDQSLDLLYLVMELVRGSDLGDLLKKGRLRTNLALEVIYQVCGALTEPHARGIVHRDLKPENLIMMPISDGTVQVKVLDFGIARALEGGTQLTKTGMVCGTPSYMAPEQAQNEGLDGRTDLYALGVMLFEMLMGQPPFVGESGLQILLKHIQRPAPRLKDLMPAGTVPDEVSELVANMMAKSPSDRPDSARAVRDEIDQIRSRLKFRPLRLDGSGDSKAFDSWVLPRIVRGGGPEADGKSGDSASDLPVGGLDDLDTGQLYSASRVTDDLDSQPTEIHRRRETEKEYIGVAETLAAPASSATDQSVADQKASDKSEEKPESAPNQQPQRAQTMQASTQVSAPTPADHSSAPAATVQTAKDGDGANQERLVKIMVALIAVGVLAMTIVAGLLIYQALDEDSETDNSQSESAPLVADDDTEEDDRDEDRGDSESNGDENGPQNAGETGVDDAVDQARQAGADSVDRSQALSDAIDGDNDGDDDDEPNQATGTAPGPAGDRRPGAEPAPSPAVPEAESGDRDPSPEDEEPPTALANQGADDDGNESQTSQQEAAPPPASEASDEPAEQPEESGDEESTDEQDEGPSLQDRFQSGQFRSD